MRPWLLLLPILASTLQLQSTTGDAATTDTGCQRPATCGNLTISYPFWLGNQTTPSCGPPAFQLNCNTAASPSAFLTTSYIRVLDIDYATRSLVAVHVNVAADAACSVLFNVSSAFAITDRFRISPSNRVLYVLYSCDGNRTPPGAVPVTNCSANNTQNFAYLGGSYGTSRPPANDGRCEITELPVLGSEAEGATADSR